jgi:alpha-ketoglutarate-dependent taurine dioxygenase
VPTDFPVLTQRVRGQYAWTAATCEARTSWYCALSEECLTALDKTIQALRRQPRPTTDVRADDQLCAACAESLRPVLSALESGRGFAIVEGLPVERYSTQECQTIYWLVGQFLGRPFAQNVQGTLLYDVRDTGQELSKGARFSVTNYESSFHTDNSFGEEILDYVGLLCLKTAKAGGLSQVLSGHAAHNVLLEGHPEELAVLYQPFHIDRRGGTNEGESPTVQYPIIQWNGRELTFRYLRYWIHAGYEKIGQPLSAAQVKALDVLDGVLRRPALRVEFTLKPGDMYFINNRWILHNRTAFEDYQELERRRHLVRLWLQTRPIR